ncbi:PmeII family type II restriction endonuclease [Sphingobacterium sp.]|uniref:PmeII family type II restriction endonuclease n=1 Tax=Sphingobacterium sp. TaxID=341027 RepID=UPI00289C515F|nr:PmeII family type II restriction endonuclease [Sphingobacterium sp.]
MTPAERQEIINRAKDFFRDRIVGNHTTTAIRKASQLKSYNINPFLYKYLANFMNGDDSPESIAKALVYPRLLGSSINTSFGMNIQAMISTLFQGMGSAVPGIDIEFTDGIDGRKKYCQLKAGPNTINHHDVETVFNHFDATRRLARTNNLDIRESDMIVGVIYGTADELSSHYLRIDERFPVIIGKDFWYRLTGDADFYLDLIEAFGEIAKEANGTERLLQAVESLTVEIRAKIEE